MVDIWGEMRNMGISRQSKISITTTNVIILEVVHICGVGKVVVEGKVGVVL